MQWKFFPLTVCCSPNLFSYTLQKYLLSLSLTRFVHGSSSSDPQHAPQRVHISSYCLNCSSWYLLYFSCVIIGHCEARLSRPEIASPRRYVRARNTGNPDGTSGLPVPKCKHYLQPAFFLKIILNVLRQRRIWRCVYN